MPWCSNTARGRRSRQLLVTKAVKHFHGSLRASIARVEQVPLPEVPRATRAISSASQQVE
ncbi:hypothetical protein MGG_15937 [Pyricularia oryzae 70-15]|uniref:Uncharacterized protein n=3 Tax=Pyricularia oryzae TaxID=318829 RepID=G4MWF0_PYRO7|nr:uncharacterized protein MGG_15937 [Pyricularia oryzae 70-15]EHA55910.1 hypothetical protein MGG_15937 [Pyricularia oryzae 70-15]ELQ43514.1 hypothetical protein OOU_Y34scaffold00148g17 [Pyricularia oryzae Y34]